MIYYQETSEKTKVQMTVLLILKVVIGLLISVKIGMTNQKKKILIKEYK